MEKIARRYGVARDSSPWELFGGGVLVTRMAELQHANSSRLMANCGYLIDPGTTKTDGISDAQGDMS